MRRALKLTIPYFLTTLKSNIMLPYKITAVNGKLDNEIFNLSELIDKANQDAKIETERLNNLRILFKGFVNDFFDKYLEMLKHINLKQTPVIQNLSQFSTEARIVLGHGRACAIVDFSVDKTNGQINVKASYHGTSTFREQKLDKVESVAHVVHFFERPIKLLLIDEQVGDFDQRKKLEELIIDKK